MTIWDRLGIEQTNDTKIIKKAYAKAVKSCHREEHPTEWQVLHDAYEKAIAYAKGNDIEFFQENVTPVKAHTPKADTPKVDSTKADVPKEKEYTSIYAQIIAKADEEAPNLKRKQSREEIQKERETLEKIKNFASFKSTQEMRNWHMYLFSEQCENRYLDYYFWKEILKALNNYKYHEKTYRKIAQDIQEIRSTLTDAPAEIAHLIKEIGLWCNHYAKRRKKILITIRNNVCIVLALVIISLCIILRPTEDKNDMVTLDFSELSQNYENQQTTQILSEDEVTNEQLPQEDSDGLSMNDIYVFDGNLENKTCYIHPVIDGVWAVEVIPNYYYSTSANDFFNSLYKESIVEKNGNTWNIKLSELFAYDVVLVFDEDKYVVEGIDGNYESISKNGLYQISVKLDRDITLTVQSFDEP